MSDKSLSFKDVRIIPKFSFIKSRKDVDISFNEKGFPYQKIPIISSNMDTITESYMASTMLSTGAQASLHRFCTIEDNIKMFKDSIYGAFENPQFPFVSVGLGPKELERAEALHKVGALFFIIDVAHGANIEVVKQTKELRSLFKNNISIIVGNFATGDSIKDFLYHSGNIVDGWKVGIGSGGLCTTTVVTGCGLPLFNSIYDCGMSTDLPIIADGGMTTSGDIAKALGVGANLVMLGSMLAGTKETPGELIERIRYDLPDNHGVHPVEFYKIYRGSASKESYEAQGKVAYHRTPEGESTLVPYKGSVVDILQTIESGLKSAFSYVGANNMKEFYELVDFVEVSEHGYQESLPHAKCK